MGHLIGDVKTEVARVGQLSVEIRQEWSPLVLPLYLGWEYVFNKGKKLRGEILDFFFSPSHHF